MKPRALDLFCGAGGATRGLQMAGFHVTGVDIRPQPRYVGDEFHQADALTFPLEGFDFIWASPPCQGYSRLRHLPWLRSRKWPLLIRPMQERFYRQRIPFVIENVEDAPLTGIRLCGLMFGLPLYRHRVFESNLLLMSPSHLFHEEVIGHGRGVNDRAKGSLNNSSAKGAWGNQHIITVAGGQFRKADGEKAMQIDWMRKDELAEAIPPAYSEFIGRQVMQMFGRDGTDGNEVRLEASGEGCSNHEEVSKQAVHKRLRELSGREGTDGNDVRLEASREGWSK